MNVVPDVDEFRAAKANLMALGAGKPRSQLETILEACRNEIMAARKNGKSWREIARDISPDGNFKPDTIEKAWKRLQLVEEGVRPPRGVKGGLDSPAGRARLADKFMHRYMLGGPHTEALANQLAIKLAGFVALFAGKDVTLSDAMMVAAVVERVSEIRANAKAAMTQGAAKAPSAANPGHTPVLGGVASGGASEQRHGQRLL